MANGSFGLSGVPTAPTTVGTVPNNALSPVTVAVNSVAGFQAGDLIYNVNGDVQPIPGNYVSTATFPVNASLPVNVPNVNFGEQQIPPVTLGYQYKGTNSAKLTNGNIVIVYLGAVSTISQRPFFKIISETGTVVVADTQITATSNLLGNTGTISVCALSGGGFTVGWYQNTNQYFAHAIYSNTGTVVKAATNDTGITITFAAAYVNLSARPDGSWIVSAISATTIYFRIYGATGTAITGWINTGLDIGVGGFQYELIVRADNSFVIFRPGGATAGLYFTVFDSAGTALIGGTVTGTNPNSRDAWGGASLLTNGNIIITWGQSTGVYYAQLDAANNISTPAFFSTLASNGLGNVSFARPIALSNGNYFVVYRPFYNVSQIQYSYVLSYIFVNTTNTIISSSTGTIIYSAVMGGQYVPTLVETASALNIIVSPLIPTNNPNTGSPNVVNQLDWIKLNMSTYEVITSTSITGNVATTSAQTVSGYARAGSTPTAASFLATTSENISVTSTQSISAATLVVGQTTLLSDTSGTYGFDTACLPDGTVLILYSTNLGTALRLSVISTAGVVLSTTILATDTYTNNNAANTVKIAVLSDGKIACTYVKSANANTLTILILSSTYGIIKTLTPTTDLANGQQYGCSITALTNARFAYGFITNSNFWPHVGVFNSSGTQLLAPTGPSVASSRNLSVSGTRSGFYVSYEASANYRSHFYTETSTNTWSRGSDTANFGATQSVYGRRATTGPNGIIYDYAASNVATTINIVILSPMVDSNSTVNYGVGVGGNYNGNYSISQAVTGYGDNVLVSWNNATTMNYLYNTAGYGIQTFGVLQNITGLSLGSTAAATTFRATGMAGHNVLVATSNAAGALTYFIFNPNAYTYSTALVAGTTPSNTTALSSAKGVALLGVSTTAAPANGSGTVQINGAAQLNSNYSATTAGQSFDFKNPVTFGAAGTISGRNVTLIGNV
jgi:hypothetical protein